MASGEDVIKGKRRNRIKWIIGIIFSLIIVSVVTFILVLDTIIKRQIIKEVYQASDGQYSLQIKTLKSKFWSGAIRMDSVWLIPNKDYILKKESQGIKAPNIRFFLDSVSISEVRWIQYVLNQKRLQIGNVVINNPQLIIKSFLTSGTSVKASSRNFLDYLPGIIAAFTGSLQIESIHVVHGKVDIDLFGNGYTVFQKIGDVQMYLDEIRIDTTGTKRALFSRQANLVIQDYKLSTTDKTSSVSIGKIASRVHDSLINFDQVQFYHKNDTVESEVDVKVKQLSAGGVDFTNLFRQKKISFRLMNFSQPEIKLYSSISSVEKTQQNNDTVSLLNEVAPFIAESFDVDTLSITEGKFFHHLKYEKKTITHSANDISLFFTKVKVDSSIAQEKLFVEDIELKLKNYRLYDSDNVLVNVNNLHASVSDSILELNGLSFSSYKTDSIHIKANSLTGKGINYLDIADSKETYFSYLGINEPDIYIRAKKTNKEKVSNQVALQNLVQPLSDFKIYSNLIEVKNGKFYQSLTTPKTHITQSASNFNVVVNKFNADKNAKAAQDLYDYLSFNFNSYNVKFQKENFYINIKEGRVDSKKKDINLEKIAISQLRSFGKHQRDFFTTQVESVNVRAFDFEKLFNNTEVKAPVVSIDKMRLFISTDELEEDTSANKKVTPQILIKKIPFPINIDSVSIANSEFIYEDIETRAISAKISFNKINAGIKNFTNDTNQVSPSLPVIISGNSHMLGVAPFNLEMKLPNLRNDLYAEISARVDPVEGDVFNELLAMGGMQVRRGDLRESKFRLVVSHDVACGQLLFQYNDLKLDLIDTVTFETKKIRGKIANFIVKDDNPGELKEDPRKADLYGRLDKDGNFVIFIWDLVSDGIISSVTKNKLFEEFVKR